MKLTPHAKSLALVAALAAALGLAGCGRKGPLEAPPSTSTISAAPPAQSTLGEPEHVGLEGEQRAAAASAPVQKKTFFLDWLLN